MRYKINGENFPEGINVWVSNPITSSKTGNTVYWGSIDEYNGGALLYLSHSVWKGLETVNSDTVLNVLLSGKFEITEARDRETNELMYTESGEQIFMVSKAREVAYGVFK